MTPKIDNNLAVTVTRATPGRRSRKQIVADETAVGRIAFIVKQVQRYDVASLRECMDKIADTLVDAGRL